MMATINGDSSRLKRKSTQTVIMRLPTMMMPLVSGLQRVSIAHEPFVSYSTRPAPCNGQ